MPERELTIINKLGLHARAASKLVTVANGYNAEIHVNRDSQRVNAKSIMGVLLLCGHQGCELTLSARGADAEDDRVVSERRPHRAFLDDFDGRGQRAD